MPNEISTQASQANIQRVQEMLRRVPPQLEALNARYTPADLAQPLEPGEWSPHRILAHLVNCEARASEAIYHALLLESPPYQPIHAERDLGALMRYEQYSFADLVTYLSFRRRSLLAVLAGLSHEQWLRPFQPVGRKQQQNVYRMARGTSIHETRHIEHIADKLSISL